MTAHISGHLRLAVSLAIMVTGVFWLGSPVRAVASPNQGASVGTPLPLGWELCVLQGVGASGTPDNVANLDEWQTVEGGSTNNAAAYNPFNTRQATGFSAFTTWADGCEATVAALLQPSMTPIVTALRAGDISVPGVFLADVDQSPWCAPSADGIPCYANEILAGELVETLLSGNSGQLKSSLTSYSQTGADLRSYEQDAVLTVADQGLLAARSAQLVSSEQQVSMSQGNLSRATRALRRLALDNYTTDAASRFDSSLPFFGPPDEQSAVAEYFRSIAASLVTLRHDRAQAALKTAVSKRRAADASVARATASLDSAAATENQALSGLEADVTSIEADLSCTAPPLVTAVAAPVASQSSAGQVWETLQGCLTRSAQLGGPPARTAAS